MASISGLGTTGLRGYGGLASGLDRDTLIEQMTAGTRSKIAVQKQRKQSMLWQQEAYRSITSKLLAFTDKYMTMSSSNSLYSSTLFSPSGINTSGANSKFVTATGHSSIADKLRVLGVKQMAKNATTTTGKVTDTSEMETGDINLNNETRAQNLEGKTISIQYGGSSSTISVTFGSSYTDENGNTVQNNYGTMSDAINSMNNSLKGKRTAGGQDLDEVVEFYDAGDNKIGMRTKGENSNHIEIKGGTALEHMGFNPDDELVFEQQADGTSQIVGTSHADLLAPAVKDGEALKGTSIDFTYNGVKRSISFDQEFTNMGDLKEYLQDELDKTFGSGRIKVGLDGADGGTTGRLSFGTKLPDGTEDKTSVLKIDSGSATARKVLGVENGASNRLNLNKKVSELTDSSGNSGLNLSQSKINGKSLQDIGITNDMTISEMIDKINSDEEVDVKISYVEGSDKFTISSTEEGASGRIKVEGDVINKLFKGMTNGAEINGQDAIIAVDYGDGAATTIQRSSNTFDLDGMTVTVSGEFGYDSSNTNLIGDSEAVTFKPVMDTQKAADAISDMVKEFNEIIDLVNTQYTTKPNRDYFPLSDEQKKEMSEDEIEAWEKEAKKGLLFNDNELSNLASDLRMTLSGLDRTALENIGITTSNSYTDNGKLVFDENKFKAALEENPEAVQEVFANADGKSGLADKMENTIEKYAKKMGAYKGSLVELAGAPEAPLSLTQNTMYNKLKDYDEVIEKLELRLETEQDRYIKQFTTLETLISQMNSQSSWLSSQFG